MSDNDDLKGVEKILDGKRYYCIPKRAYIHITDPLARISHVDDAGHEYWCAPLADDPLPTPVAE